MELYLPAGPPLAAVFNATPSQRYLPQFLAPINDALVLNAQVDTDLGGSTTKESLAVIADVFSRGDQNSCIEHVQRLEGPRGGIVCLDGAIKSQRMLPYTVC